MENKNKAAIFKVDNFYGTFNLIPQRTLGKGMTGDVVLATAKGQGKVKRAVKVYKPLKTCDSAELFEREVSLLQSLSHPNICRIIVAARESESLAFLCMPFYEGGTLQDIYQTLSEAKIELIFVQISSALGYMHSKRVCHFDIKKDNIFIQANGDAVLGDLGVSFRIPDGQKTMQSRLIGGTLWAYPPELCNRTHRNKYVDPFKIDSFALGVLLWELIFRLSGHPSIDYLTHIRQFKLPQLFSLCLECLLQPVARHRATLQDLMCLLKKESQYSQRLQELETPN